MRLVSVAIVVLSAMALFLVWRSTDPGTDSGADVESVPGELVVSEACREFYDQLMEIHLDAGFPAEYVNTIWEMSFAAEEYDDPEVFAEELFARLMPIMEQVIADDPTGGLAELEELLTRIEDFQQSMPLTTDCR